MRASELDENVLAGVIDDALGEIVVDGLLPSYSLQYEDAPEIARMLARFIRSTMGGRLGLRPVVYAGVKAANEARLGGLRARDPQAIANIICDRVTLYAALPRFRL